MSEWFISPVNRYLYQVTPLVGVESEPSVFNSHTLFILSQINDKIMTKCNF